jgi:2-amino-4-hydroxy-6-hydroxymethyldihydropteridine diphosphokinase
VSAPRFALLSLGGNIGERKALMDAAVVRLAALPATKIVARSSYYRSAPDGPVAQDWFVNLAVTLTTQLSATDLAASCRAIEADLGRDRTKEISWGPRPIDIDRRKRHSTTARSSSSPQPRSRPTRPSRACRFARAPRPQAAKASSGWTGRNQPSDPYRAFPPRFSFGASRVHANAF